MNRLREELRIIPRPAWVVAALVYVVVMALLTWVTLAGHSAELRNMNMVLKVLFSKVLPIVPFAMVLLIGYVHADAKRRGMRYIMWTFLAIFLPQAMGILLYFIFREPLPRSCPACARPIGSGFAFCPFCGHSLAQACPQCKRSVELSWANCAYCGSALPRTGPPAAT
jgi:RNA polymerase subunit RPABC4/transcription elongation factor Spt4